MSEFVLFLLLLLLEQLFHILLELFETNDFHVFRKSFSKALFTTLLHLEIRLMFNRIKFLKAFWENFPIETKAVKML